MCFTKIPKGRTLEAHPECHIFKQSLQNQVLHEIVFFRQDLIYRMHQSGLIPPSTEETDYPFEHLVATIIHQNRLCPHPLMVQPIIWNYNHSLHLYPTPYTVVLGDKSKHIQIHWNHLLQSWFLLK